MSNVARRVLTSSRSPSNKVMSSLSIDRPSESEASALQSIHTGSFPELLDQASAAGKLLGMPWDSGPIAMLYRQDLFGQHKIEVPATWDQFAEQAIKLHEAAPETFLTDATFSDGGWRLPASVPCCSGLRIATWRPEIGAPCWQV